jgi:Tfp pilus assembly protein PilF
MPKTALPGLVIVVAVAALVHAQAGAQTQPQAPDGAYAKLEQAYQALNAKDYARAVNGFEEALAAPSLDPKRAAGVHKDLAYTLLKIGENERARDQFAEAARLDPADEGAALEYGFLCNETKQPAAARHTFLRLRTAARDAANRATAAEAFEHIDRPLAEGIARWRQALALDPGNFSAHEELARLAEQRDELPLAAEQYRDALRIKPQRGDLLLDLGRVLKAMGRDAEAQAAWVAASQDRDPRVAVEARALLPAQLVAQQAPVLAGTPPVPNPAQFEGPSSQRTAAAGAPDARASEARIMAAKSLEKGYLEDALKYLWVAHQTDPANFEVMLDMGRTYNTLKDDTDAIQWFNKARRSPDARVAQEAAKAYHNLAPALERFRTTVWAFPMFSSRWHDMFAYAQVKTELRIAHWFVRPYLSVRFIGDTRGAVDIAGSIGPQYLSENSVIVGGGVATQYWHGATAWFEAGESLPYRESPIDKARAIPDFRGGVSFARGIGQVLRPGAHGLYAETNDDGVFVSRFSDDSILYSQNRAGYTFRSSEGLGGLHAQIYWNGNVTTDMKRQYWANTVETGPGLRFRFEGLPAGMLFSINALRGAYLVNAGNPQRPNFNDLRVGIWYALTH